MLTQFPGHRISPNIACLLLERLVVPDTMVKEVLLPKHPISLTNPLLPIAHDTAESALRVKTQQRMNVVRH
jgi:hypothetical protein